MFLKDARVLVVEDDPVNMEILELCLKSAHYEVLTATNGREALGVLKEEHIDIIVLDRMMPVMDGMTFLQRLKAEPAWRQIPVIMQTAATERDRVEEGIRAGVYYYLTKPYSKQVLLAIVKSALDDCRMLQKLLEESERITDRMRELRRGLIHMQSSHFSFKTPAQAKRIASVVASCFSKPSHVILGFTELMLNAIEHGNLGISFEEKKELLLTGMWEQEVEQRLSDPSYMLKDARIFLNRNDRNIEITIEDDGKGFEWERFMTLDASRADAPNGRGIYLASMDFDTMAYMGSGNKVICTKTI